jgi:hypothetical protein
MTGGHLSEPVCRWVRDKFLVVDLVVLLVEEGRLAGVNIPQT